MKSQSRPWLLGVIVLAVCAVAVGYMEAVKREERAAVEALEATVQQKTKQVRDLQGRERALETDRTVRRALADRLMNPAEGTYYAQLMMTLVRASREAGLQLSTVSYGQAQPLGGVVTASITTSLTGTEAQLAKFVELLEQGSPVGQFGRLNWELPITAGDPSDAASGTLAVELQLFGPLQP